MSRHTSHKSLAVTSQMLLCLIETNPPFLQVNAFCSESLMPHSQNLGVLESCHLYQIWIRSQNDCFFRAYPSCFSGRVVNQAEVPVSWFKSLVCNCSEFMCEQMTSNLFYSVLLWQHEFYFWWFEFLYLVHTDASGWWFLLTNILWAWWSSRIHYGHSLKMSTSSSILESCLGSKWVLKFYWPYQWVIENTFFLIKIWRDNPTMADITVEPTECFFSC